MRTTTVAALIICLLAPDQPRAADDRGNYAVWGPGRKSCFHYLKDRRGDAETPYRSYVMGYLTAYNAITPETYSISPGMGLDDVLAWLDAHCETKKLHSLEQSLIEFTTAHHEKRQRTPTQGRVGR